MTNKLAQEIQRRLKKLGLTPITAAQKAGIPRDSIRDIVRGKSLHPSHSLLVKVAHVLECKPEELTGEPASPGEGLLADVYEAYHSLEWYLCILFSRMTRLPPEDAGIIFFALGSPTRLQVFRDLKQLHYPDLHEPYWRSLVAELAVSDASHAEMLRLSQRSSTRFSNEQLHHIRDRLVHLHTAVWLFGQDIIGWSARRPDYWKAALEVPLIIPPPPEHPFAKVTQEASAGIYN